MIVFNINGETLDLYANTGLQVQRGNMLFAFDDIELSRSTSFEVPATPNNNRIFALANDPLQAGGVARKRLQAQLQYSAGVIDGYLYITESSAKSYKLLFVFGELMKLKEIKEAGKIEEYLNVDWDITWSDSLYPVYTNNALARINPFYAIRYKNGVQDYWQQGINIMPSFLLKSLTDVCAEYFGVALTRNSNTADRYRLVIPKPLQKDDGVTQQLIKDESGTIDHNGIDNDILQVENIKVNYFRQYVAMPWQCQFWVARQDMTIKFAQGISDSYFLMTTKQSAYGNTVFDFLGGYTFPIEYEEAANRNNSDYWQGEPLGGRSIEIKAGTPFTLMTPANYIYNETTYGEYGFSSEPVPFSFEIAIGSLSSTVEYGNIIKAAANLPDVTFVDLLKTEAALLGKALYYTTNGGITYEDCNYGTWARLEVSDEQLISIGSVTRTFGDYARRNLIQFDSAEYVPDGERVDKAYAIDNDNIEAEKELLQIPFSEGARYSILNNVAFVDDTQREETTKDGEQVVKYTIDGGKFSLLYCGDSGYMERPTVATAEWLQNLLIQSTKISAQIKMPLFQFMQLSEKTVILLRGGTYVWTRLQWSGDVATMELNRVRI